MNFLYPRLGKENSPRLRLEWLPSGIISNQSLDLSFHHFNISFLHHPHIQPLFFELGHFVLSYASFGIRAKVTKWSNCIQAHRKTPKPRNTKQTHKPANRANPETCQPELWHGVPVRLGTTVPSPFSAFSKLEHKHGSLVPHYTTVPSILFSKTTFC